MSNLLLPPSARPAQPAVQPGTALESGWDGPNLWLKITTLVVMSPENGAQISQAVLAAAQQAHQIRQAIASPAGLPAKPN